MTELDELARDLLQAADTWLSDPLHLKLQRLIAIARETDRAPTGVTVEFPFTIAFPGGRRVTYQKPTV